MLRAGPPIADLKPDADALASTITLFSSSPIIYRPDSCVKTSQDGKMLCGRRGATTPLTLSLLTLSHQARQ